MKPARELQWVRMPHQERSRQTLERLLDAAEALLQKRGFDSVSVAEIAQAGHSSVGAFYARFRDKAGLLNHLHERFYEEATATARTTLEPSNWQDATAREILAAVTTFLVEIYRTRNGLFRAFLMQSCSDAQFQERDRRLAAQVMGGLAVLLTERRAEIDHPEPAFAAAFGFELISGVLRDRYVLNHADSEIWPEPPQGLETELTRAYANYLGLPRAAAPADAAPLGRTQAV